ncbi:MAG: Bax inhibitor-1 family protein, partial [bacterium]|nr:Bax inhibitor-1 family protein [bacterium]
MDDVILEKNYGIDTNNFLVKTFARMFLGLFVTAIVSFYTFRSGLYLRLLNSFSVFLILIVEIAVVLVFSFLFKKLSPTAVTVLFFVYAAINGISLSTIFYLYDLNTITYAFLASAALFGGLALYGYTTKADISKLRTILLIGLIARYNFF